MLHRHTSCCDRSLTSLTRCLVTASVVCLFSLSTILKWRSEVHSIYALLLMIQYAIALRAHLQTSEALCSHNWIIWNVLSFNNIYIYNIFQTLDVLQCLALTKCFYCPDYNKTSATNLDHCYRLRPTFFVSHCETKLQALYQWLLGWHLEQWDSSILTSPILHLLLMQSTPDIKECWVSLIWKQCYWKLQQQKISTFIVICEGIPNML